VKYASYSRLYLPLTNIIALGLAFAAFPAVFVHTFCEFCSRE